MANPSLTTPLPFGEEVSPASVEMSESGVRHVIEIFERQLAEGLHPGAQLVVLRRGQVVIDRAGGWANVKRGIRVMPGTPFMTYSCTKAFTGMCVQRLIEEGKVELDAPVARYWPEFACRGKEAATIRQAFLHQAGIPVRGLYAEMLMAWNWNWVARYVAGLEAEFPPGSQCIYHMVNYGYILGELIRRVSGLRVDHYLRQTFFEPLGMRNSYLGLPRSQQKRSAWIYLGHRQQFQFVVGFHLPFLRSAVIPAATLNSSARDIAIFYQMLLNGGTYAGKQLLRPETIQSATSLGYRGVDERGRFAVRWAYGFHLGGSDNPDPTAPNGMGRRSTLHTFGHFGQASCMAWADFDQELVVIFTCNRLLYQVDADHRWQELSDAIWDACI